MCKDLNEDKEKDISDYFEVRKNGKPVNPLIFLSCFQKSSKGLALMVVHANQYLFQKRGIFYFHRRVPKDLMSHYDRSKIVFSLRTKSIRAAKIQRYESS